MSCVSFVQLAETQYLKLFSDVMFIERLKVYTTQHLREK
jgi:hypothetical protein